MKIYKCDQCDGEGKVKLTPSGGMLPTKVSNSTTDTTITCPNCDGDGWVIRKKNANFVV